MFSVSCASVPKVGLVVGHTHGAGTYAMAGRAYADVLIAWPSAAVAVMGKAQAADVLTALSKVKPWVLVLVFYSWFMFYYFVIFYFVVGLLVDWLVGWLVGWLVDWLVDWLVGLLVCFLFLIFVFG